MVLPKNQRGFESTKDGKHKSKHGDLSDATMMQDVVASPKNKGNERTEHGDFTSKQLRILSYVLCQPVDIGEVERIQVQFHKT